MIARPVPSFTLSNRSGFSRWQRVLAALGEWSAVRLLASHSEPLWRERPERLRRFCRDCGEDTAHELLDEFGVGWYAQTFCCRQCGRQGMRVWPLACW